MSVSVLAQSLKFGGVDMKKYYKGEYIEMTAEEIEALKADMPAEQTAPSFDDRLKAVEQGFAKLEKLFSALRG